MTCRLLPFLLLLANSPLAPARADEPLRLRVLSYNIHHGEGTDAKLDLPRIAKIIQSVEPDLVSLQEVDRGAERSNRLDEPAELARLTGLHPVFGPNIPLQGGDYGNAVLSRLPVASWRNVPLPSHHEGEQRGALVLELTAPGDTPLRFIATHFDHRPDDAERLDSVKTLESIVAEKPDVPTLLAGDLNARPDSRTLAGLSPHWAGAGGEPLPTFPSAQPTRQIDYVLARPAHRWKVVESRVLDEPIASDHRPLLVVLELAGQKP